MTPTDQTAEILLCRLRRGTMLTAVGRISGMGTVFILHIFLARTLETSEYAMFVLVWSWTTLFSLIGIFGLSTLACRYLAESFAKGDLRRARQTLRQITSLSAASIVASALLGALLLQLVPAAWFPLPTTSATAVAVWIALLAVSQIQAEMFRGIHHLFAASLFGGMSGGLVSNLAVLVMLATWSCFWPLSVKTLIWVIYLALGFKCVVRATSADGHREAKADQSLC